MSARRSKTRSRTTEILIDSLDAKGVSGLDANKNRWSCKGPAIGDRVTIQRKKKGKAVLVAILEESADRVTPKCSHFLTCGGCQLQHTPLEKQREAKQAYVERLFQNFQGIIHTIRGADSGYHYRNKMELSFGTRRFYTEPPEEKPENGSFLGMHPWGWYSKIVPLTECALAEESIDQAIQFFSTLELKPAWDTYEHQGVWRHVVFREGGGLSINLITSSQAKREQVLALAQDLQQLPNVRGIIWTINDGVAEVATGALKEILYGTTDIEIPLLDKKLLLPHTGFAQVNNQGAKILLETIIEACQESKGTLLDLYCGSGAIGLALSDFFDDIIGIEIQPQAIEQAKQNAERMGIKGTWLAGPVEKIIPTLSWSSPATIIVDPPREGLHPKAAQFLASQAAEQLIYIACNPKSLARDQEILEQGSWQLEQIWSVDLFPQTPHLELVGRFVRKNNRNAE